MPDAVATTAYQLQSEYLPRRNWLGKSAEQLRAESREQQQFWLVFGAPNATLLPAMFRLPSRDYPFLVTGAAVNLPVTSLKLFTANEQLNSYGTPVEAVAGGSNAERNLFVWQEPILLQPHEAWRLQLTLAEASGLGLHTIIALRGVKLGKRK
jgi:hypothetical protein